MALTTLAETKVVRLPGRNPALPDSANSYEDNASFLLAAAHTMYLIADQTYSPFSEKRELVAF
jgi:hypothetical protein